MSEDSTNFGPTSSQEGVGTAQESGGLDVHQGLAKEIMTETVY